MNSNSNDDIIMAAGGEVEAVPMDMDDDDLTCEFYQNCTDIYLSSSSRVLN